MILTFDTFENNWIIKYNIEAAIDNALNLQIGLNPPSVGIINRNHGTLIYRNGFRGVGNVHVFFGHGSVDNIDKLNPQEFCTLLKNVSWMQDTSLLLVSCRSGQATYAKQVAEILKIDVFAPVGRCIFGKKRFAVIDDKYYIAVKKEQDNLYNSGKNSDEIFTSLINYVQNNHYGVVRDWIKINDIHNDFTKMGFKKFTNQ